MFEPSVIVDLFCKAGGASMGLHDVWRHARIVGVDIEPQPNYPFEFVQADAFDYSLVCADFVWASPKCQRHSTMTKRWARSENHQNQIPGIREKLIESGLPYVIENVPGAPLLNPVLLCGSMFGLKVRRHRHFECSFPVLAPSCQHNLQPETVGVYGHAGGRSKRDGISFKGTAAWKEAMGIDWMTGNELAQAVPPAYSRYIAQQASVSLSGAHTVACDMQARTDRMPAPGSGVAASMSALQTDWSKQGGESDMKWADDEWRDSEAHGRD